MSQSLRSASSKNNRSSTKIKILMQVTNSVRLSFNILTSKDFFVLQVWDQNFVFLSNISFCIEFSSKLLSSIQKTLILTLNSNIKMTTEFLNKLYTQVNIFQYALSIANIYIHKQSLHLLSSSSIQIVFFFSKFRLSSCSFLWIFTRD